MEIRLQSKEYNLLAVLIFWQSFPVLSKAIEASLLLTCKTTFKLSLLIP